MIKKRYPKIYERNVSKNLHNIFFGYEDENIIKMIKQKENINNTNVYGDNFLIDYMMENFHCDHENYCKFMKLLIKNGLNIDNQNIYGQTLLMETLINSSYLYTVNLVNELTKINDDTGLQISDNLRLITRILNNKTIN